MQSPDRRSHSAVFITLLACGIGWFLLPYAPGGYMPGETPGRLGMLQHMVTWWPLMLIAAFGIGLALPKRAPGSAARWTLLVLQWVLTYASIAMIVAILFEVFFPRPT